MADAYIEPKPTVRHEHDAIDHYVIEHANGAKIAGHKNHKERRSKLQGKRAPSACRSRPWH